MRQKRSADGFNIAFLDVMACGLGAIILILMLVKFNATTEVPTEDPQDLRQQLQALEKETSAVENASFALSDKLARESASIAQLKRRIAELEVDQRANQQALAESRAVLAKVEESIAAAAPRQSDDNLVVAGAGEEDYLLGLKVEGQHIGILIDSSASMTDEKLIDVIKRKISNDASKQRGAKWRRTKRVATWLLARLPPTSKVSVVTYNDSATKVGPRGIVSANSTVGMRQLARAIESIVPRNGTNLQLALSEISTLSPQLTHLYIVTDGLPTLGVKSKTLKSLTRCGSLFGSDKTITGECRLSLFAHTLKQTPLSGVQVNVVLLPLEGDPHAPQAYWNWTASTGGLMLSPAASWP
ncbi:VWA domain-containing protein [Gammaproteobacteria bacterium]|nr:VWA domain-containing protein [Gammaproteobacteria bacterium]